MSVDKFSVVFESEPGCYWDHLNFLNFNFILKVKHLKSGIDTFMLHRWAHFLFLLPWNIMCKWRENSEEGTGGRLSGNVHCKLSNVLQCALSLHDRSPSTSCLWVNNKKPWERRPQWLEKPLGGGARVTLQIFKIVSPAMCLTPQMRNRNLDNSKRICCHNYTKWEFCLRSPK